MRPKRLASYSIVVASAFLMNGGALSTGFVADRPWLAERSLWSETVGDGEHLRGWWAVGNSRVFGIVGTGNPITTIHQITGPHIMLAGLMNNGSAFGPSSLSLEVGGKPVKFTRQTLAKVRGTDIVVMELVSDDVEMTVFNYAPFDVNAMLRTVVIKNTSSETVSDVILRANVYRTVVKDGLLYDDFKGSTGGSAMGETRQLFSSFIEPAEVTSNDQKAGLLTVKIGDIEPGAEAVRTQYLAFSMKEIGGEDKTLELVKTEGTKLLRKTYGDWRSWLASTARLDCPDQRLVDLIDDNKILVKIQTAEPQCAAGPMEFFAGVWVRDSNGPFLYYLRMGELEAARKMLEFYYRASAYNKNIANNMPMDIDVTKPIDPDLDWTKIHNDPVEIPCWLIMQHERYFKYTGDIEPIRQHWGYLKKCLHGQLNDDKGEPFHTVNFASKEPGANKMYRFPHHGDETWIYPGFEVLNSQLFPEPNDHPHWDSYSADSTWEFVVAAETMAEFARILGDETEAEKLEVIARESRAACERDYWMPQKGFYAPAVNMRSLDIHQPPFAMVNFNPLWIGYLEPEDPKAVSNVLETMKYTMNPNYVTDATETLRIYVGMQPGMFLYNLAAIDHPYGEEALSAMVEVASPSGEYTEKHVTDPSSYETGFLGHRIRPWEGGINMDAAYYYLTGLAPEMGNNRIALCPRMPSNWNEMEITGQKLGDGELDLLVSDDGGRRTYAMKWMGSEPITADFRISLPKSKISSVRIGRKTARVSPKSRWGMTTAELEVRLASGRTTTISVDYQREESRQPEFVRERYHYIVPKGIPTYEMVYWENEPRKRNAEDLRTFDLLEGKVNFRLISAFNPDSPDWLRPFLIKANGKINSPLFLMGTNSIASSLKYAKWWGNPDLTKLFKEYMEAGGAIVAVKTGEKSSDLFGELLGDSEYFIIPSEATTVIPDKETESQIFELLGIGDNENRFNTSGAYIYQNMIVIGRPETEHAAGAVLAKRVGKGLFMTILGDLTYEQMATLAQNLANPKRLSEINRIISSSKPQSVAGAFEDFAKDNSYSDDFDSFKDGSVGVPVWLPLHGNWRMQDGEYHQLNTNGYDFISTANARIKGDYVIEARMKRVENIFEGGFVFNLPSRFSKGSSQMVRFCGHETLWCGPFSPGGGFTLENSISAKLTVRDEEWHTLKLVVRNSEGLYDITVDGKNVARGLKLTNISKNGCYIGLVACRGHVAFEDLKVYPLKGR